MFSTICAFGESEMPPMFSPALLLEESSAFGIVLLRGLDLRLIQEIDASLIRIEPVGKDSDGDVYWYFTGTRLYKEGLEVNIQANYYNFQV